MEVQVVIKAPNQNIDDFSVYCNLNWTVEKLKEHLSKAYPSKPKVQEQKLIYSGRLLHNHLHLKDVLRHEESQTPVHILHLVCSSSSYEQASRTWGNPSTTHSQAPNNPSGVQSSSSTARQRNVASAPRSNTLFPQISRNPAPQATMPVFVPDSQVAAQIAAMQQMYAYYFTQYIQSINPPTVPANNPAFPDLSNYQPHVNDIPAQAQGNRRINPQGAQILEEIEDFVVNRDWLDHLFLCCRLMILFSVVFFYSTPERLMIVIVFAVIAFLYQEGWFVRRANPAPPAEVPAPQENQNNFEVPPDFDNSDEEPLLVNPDLSANEAELLGEHELEATMDGDEPPHAQQASVADNNHIFSPLTFLSTFFSSLIPEPPPPVNIN